MRRVTIMCGVAALAMGVVAPVAANAADEDGPEVVLTAPVDGVVTAAATVTIAGSATDISGVAGVTVGGFAAPDPAAFAIDVPLAIGANAIAVIASDTLGNHTSVTRTVVREETPDEPGALRIRARGLSFQRISNRRYIRFRVDPGAVQIAVRLWRRVMPAGAPSRWVPVSSLRYVGAKPGLRRALLTGKRLVPGVYQARVSVVSAGGVAVTTVRHVVLRPPPGR